MSPPLSHPVCVCGYKAIYLISANNYKNYYLLTIQYYKNKNSELEL